MTTAPQDLNSKVAISRALQVLNVFRAIDHDMPIGEAVTFLMVAAGETQDSGLSVTEVHRNGGFALSSASRYVQSLGEMDRHRRPGKKLLTDHIDPMERRKKILRLSPQGRFIINQIKQAAGG